MDIDDPKKALIEKLLRCVKNGVQLDPEGHGLKRMVQRNIDFQTIEEGLSSADKIENIERYDIDSNVESYRVFIKLSENKTLVVGVILKDICIIKTVFIRSKKYQGRVDKLWRNSR
jgi:Domain of unknown function (DUF4258)